MFLQKTVPDGKYKIEPFRYPNYWTTQFSKTLYLNDQRLIYSENKMLRDLSTTQRRLAEYMSELSEEAYYARWMDGLEFDLWKAVNGNLTEYGRLLIEDKIIERLTQLSTEAKGWIYFDDKLEEIFMPMDVWKEIVKRRFE